RHVRAVDLDHPHRVDRRQILAAEKVAKDFHAKKLAKDVHNVTTVRAELDSKTSARAAAVEAAETVANNVAAGADEIAMIATAAGEIATAEAAAEEIASEVSNLKAPETIIVTATVLKTE
ncbi:MAG: hypothetical protein V4692_05850, partial [Bdellovibrionota bacterium]